MKISVLITVIAAARIVRSATFSERPDAKVELHPRMKTRLQAQKQKAKANPPGPTKVIKKPNKTKPINKAKAKAHAQANGPIPNIPVPALRVCPTNGFSSTTSQCTCNFAGACDPKTNVASPAAQANPKNLNAFAPQGLDSLALGVTKNVGTICEGGVVAVLYDCNARSALYAATVINGADLSLPANPAIARKNSRWKPTSDPTLLKTKQLLAQNKDYKGSNNKVYCYDDGKGNLLNWDGTGPCGNPQPALQIHIGHLIACSYGKIRQTQNAMDATFAYTNAVPQVGRFNSVEWRMAEADVIKKAGLCQTNAQKRGKGKAINAKMYVVVGVIPSSFLGKPRFFGSTGFGSSQGAKTGGYRISFPEIMWTAGCCIYTDGSVGGKFGFWRRNDLTIAPVNQAASPDDMFKDIQTEISNTWPGPPAIVFNPPIIFPNKQACNN